MEVPCALPLIFSGLRSAMLQIIATATIAAIIGLGGLGRFLIDGLAVRDYAQMAAGAVLVAVLALLVDLSRAGAAPGRLARADRRRSPGDTAPGARRREDSRAEHLIDLGCRTTRNRTDCQTDHRPRRDHSHEAHDLCVALIAASLLGLPPAAAPATRSPPRPDRSASGGASGGTIVVGWANFPESQLLAEIYAGALPAKGVKVDKKLNIGSRETYIPALKDGSIDLIPEYTGVLASLQQGDTGTDAEGVYKDVQAVLPKPDRPRQVRGRGQGRGRGHQGDRRQVQAEVHRRPAARRQGPDPGCAAGVEDPPARCARPEEGLRPHFKTFRPLDGRGLVQALKNGQVQAANIFTTDPSIAANGFVVLEDPKSLFAAQNVVPLMRADNPTRSRTRSTRSRPS